MFYYKNNLVDFSYSFVLYLNHFFRFRSFCRYARARSTLSSGSRRLSRRKSSSTISRLWRSCCPTSGPTSSSSIRTSSRTWTRSSCRRTFRSETNPTLKRSSNKSRQINKSRFQLEMINRRKLMLSSLKLPAKSRQINAALKPPNCN